MPGRAGDFQIGADQRRAAQRREDAAPVGRLVRYGPPDRRAQPRGIGVVFRKPTRQPSNELAVGAEPEDLEAGHAALGKAIATVAQRTLPRRVAHGISQIWPAI
jgi:hypothetical protein